MRRAYDGVNREELMRMLEWTKVDEKVINKNYK